MEKPKRKLTQAQIQAILKELKRLEEIINNTIIDNYLEDIVKLILAWYKNPIESKYQEFEDNLVDLILKINEKVYSLTSAEIKKIYKIKIPLPISKILTYEKDGKTLRERIRRWFCPKNIGFNEEEELYWLINENNEDFINDKSSAVIKITSIIMNEANYQKQTVMYDKLHELCDFVYLPGGECQGGCLEGEYPVDEFFDYPPYHPNCGCIPIYEVTDVWDEIEELGLEDEAKGE